MMGINQRREFLDCGLVRHSRYLSNTVMPQKMYIRRALVLITDNPIYSGFKCVLVISLLSRQRSNIKLVVLYPSCSARKEIVTASQITSINSSSNHRFYSRNRISVIKKQVSQPPHTRVLVSLYGRKLAFLNIFD